ncbi:MAG: hypothetical protein NZ584_08015 [Acidimicrobiales bacterium]|nr:hypothetical protein [Acidimicrobiales bacterium]
METRLPFANHPPTRRPPNRVASPSIARTPARRLDDRTREIGRAGVASARLVLAACSRQAPDRSGASNDDPTDGGPTGNDSPTGNDDPTDGAPIDGTHRGLPEAA